MTRDRDPAGRPRNARPRDGLGRPLDRTGEPDPVADRIPDDLVITGAAAAALADRLDLWQGLAQIAVGLTHARRGNARGAVTLLGRGVQRVRDYQNGGGVQDGDGSRRAARREASPFGMNIVSFLAAADDLAARIERDGLDAIPAADLSPGLLAVRG